MQISQHKEQQKPLKKGYKQRNFQVKRQIVPLQQNKRTGIYIKLISVRKCSKIILSHGQPVKNVFHVTFFLFILN